MLQCHRKLNNFFRSIFHYSARQKTIFDGQNVKHGLKNSELLQAVILSCITVNVNLCDFLEMAKHHFVLQAVQTTAETQDLQQMKICNFPTTLIKGVSSGPNKNKSTINQN